LASRRLRLISGRSRRSSPSCSIRSNANSTASWPRRRLRSAWKSGVPSSRANHRLAIDQKRRRLEAESSVNNDREAIGPVMAVAREAADAPSRRTISR
jgi:hypothetical protein